MADVPVTIFRGRKTRAGTSPSIPSGVEGEPLPPINPPGSNPIGGSKIHNDLEEIQGGIEGERYHLTDAELLKLQEMPDPATGFLDTNAVHYDRDDAKTELEKAQARDNIDVFSRDEVKEITGELPDLNTADKTNLVSAINQKGQYRSAGW